MPKIKSLNYSMFANVVERMIEGKMLGLTNFVNFYAVILKNICDTKHVDVHVMKR